MTLHIGFTGTRNGMTAAQLQVVRSLVSALVPSGTFSAHHGDCIGADAEFHAICGTFCGRAFVTVHPGPVGDLSAGCIAFERMDPMPYPKRNRAIVNSSHVMIAAPYEDEPQRSGGTWSTIRIARKSLRLHLRELHVVGRDGRLLDHRSWT